MSRFFLTHPELNTSAVARRMGIQQSLLASYIRGTKKPSKERENEIMNTIHQIGKELSTAKL
ncbi:MAG: XRE family transcriptional regulator [Tannerella sp.]|nr:XRE family transcriptional regulator [Tannerella sp.]